MRNINKARFANRNLERDMFVETLDWVDQRRFQ
jgi:hypothetical protein